LLWVADEHDVAVDHHFRALVLGARRADRWKHAIALVLSKPWMAPLVARKG
jgi:hypothetical protein